MVVDKNGRLWLIRATLLAVPQWSWGSALVRYQVSTDYQKPGRPTWQKDDVLIPHVEGIESVLDQSFARMEQDGRRSADRLEAIRNRTKEMLKNPIYLRLGWMPRAHPFVRSDGTVIVPLSNENFNVAAMAMTSDGGETWTMSKPVPEAGLTQPTLVEFADGRMSAFFRNSDPRRRIKRSDSSDGGMTWSEVSVTTLPHPGAGIEALRLSNGHLAMVYNDKEENPRDRMAISISTDGGANWNWTRRLDDVPQARFDYPSIIQARDGTLHVTYSDNLKTIKHVHINEEWVQQGK
jgi:predicted neuraminidase